MKKSVISKFVLAHPGIPSWHFYRALNLKQQINQEEVFCLFTIRMIYFITFEASYIIGGW